MTPLPRPADVGVPIMEERFIAATPSAAGAPMNATIGGWIEPGLADERLASLHRPPPPGGDLRFGDAWNDGSLARRTIFQGLTLSNPDRLGGDPRVHLH